MKGMKAAPAKAMKAMKAAPAKVMKAMKAAVALPAPLVGAALGKPPIAYVPTEYHGGKIYFNAKRDVFRVYLRKGDTVEKSVSVDPTHKKSAAKSWADCLAKIDSDPRPRE